MVGFDQSKGIIQTNARKTFLVAVASIGANSSAWQQWPANIHYKCDLNASCMLTRRGATVLHAQAEKVSRVRQTEVLILRRLLREVRSS